MSAVQKTIKPAYWFGDFVIVRTDPDKVKGQITGVQLNPGGGMMYRVEWPADEHWFFSFQLEDTDDEVIKPPPGSESTDED